MPEDDGSEVRIEAEATIHDIDGRWLHIVKVCNLTQQQKDLLVTSWPYYEGEDNKTGRPIEEVVILPPGECQHVIFNISGRPRQYYTDVYSLQIPTGYSTRWRYHYTVNGVGSGGVVDLKWIYDHVLHPLGHVWYTMIGASIPYPRSLEPAGVVREYYIKDIHGLPEGIDLEVSWPAVGETFAMTPDEKSRQLNLLLKGKDRKHEDGIFTVSVDVGIRGEEFCPPYTVPVKFYLIQGLESVRLAETKSYWDEERPWIWTSVVLTQKFGLLDTPQLKYSKDNGKTWKSEYMQFSEALEFTELGLSKASFNLAVPVSGYKESILTILVVNDQLGNSTYYPLDCFPDRPPQRGPK
ncbi:hypothetical protein [Marinigracilibium pacificum]|uniref:Uncharacterized protein n=1 Tax=Marinigracilibium pacificum TaxID=2729599 RepID=A0A848J6D1_9BACT|nr:hypothetical protein [Marinigracilibium pacificum]NMM50798.1 hypothetical protein [Marinigracilibium pacificum]